MFVESCFVDLVLTLFSRNGFRIKEIYSYFFCNFFRGKLSCILSFLLIGKFLIKAKVEIFGKCLLGVSCWLF